MNVIGKLGARQVSTWLGLLAVSLLLSACSWGSGSSNSRSTNQAAQISGSTNPVVQPGVTAPPQSDQSKNASEEADRLKIGEMVEIEFSDTPVTWQPHKEQIKEDGTISLPLIGKVQAGGKRRGELQYDIQKKYLAQYFNRINIRVNTEGRVYTVSGEVKRPDRVLYLGETTLLKAIASVGDFTDYAKKTKVVITRASGEQITVNTDKARKNPSLDLPIYPGDNIFVPRSWY